MILLGICDPSNPAFARLRYAAQPSKRQPFEDPSSSVRLFEGAAFEETDEESEERDEEKAWLVGRERQSQNRFISSLNAFLI